ncbi:antitoxin Xre/MbcA/ParS toxin-binding domain-containing protein [Pseudomonas sp. NFX98]|uniref:antitoxin Xre/MbcA/ParS toxin-binding domain-containing protein n=1 Tax=Pseudomonas sp. NFX98 TaxID=3399122 RepID=UPI0039FCD6F2
MLAELLPPPAYRNYRCRLEASLQITLDASEQEIHALIVAGFAAERVKMFSDLDLYDAVALDQIIPLGTLYTRLARGQRLSLGESDRLFRLAHVTAMAEALFGDIEKARRWLSKPKQRFAWQPPIALLSTTQGTRMVEELLIQVAEGLAL